MYTSRTILKAIGVPKLDLFNGGGYWVFVIDDLEAKKYITQSVMVFRLKQMSFDQWVDEGRSFAKLHGYEAKAETAPTRKPFVICPTCNGSTAVCTLCDGSGFVREAT